MNDSTSTPDNTRHDITAWLQDRYGLQLYLESAADGTPALHLADGGGSVRIGGYDHAVALTEALHSTTTKLGAGPQPVPAPSSFTDDSARRDELELPTYLRDLDIDTTAGRAEAEVRAIAYPCGVPGCHGQSHEWTEDPSQWLHTLERIEAGRLRVETYVPAERDIVHVDVYLEDSKGADYTTENELRALAAELRSYATIIERQVTALELHGAQLKRSQS